MDKAQKTPLNTFSKIFGSYAKNHPWTILFYVAFGIFWAFTLPYMSYLLGTIIDEIKIHDPMQVPVLKLVIVPLGLYVSIHVLRSFGYYTHDLFDIISIPAQKGFLVKKLFKHLCGQSVDYFEQRKSGFLSGRITNTCISLEPLIISIFKCIFPQSLALLLTGILLSTVVPYFGLVLWGWGLVMIVYTYRAAKVGQQKAGVFADACSQFNGHVVDVVSNIPSVIINETQPTESKHLDDNLAYLIQTERARNRHANRVSLVQFLAMNALVAFYLIGSVIGYDRGLVTIGEVVFVMTAVTGIAGLAHNLGRSFLDFIYNLGMLKEGLSLLEDHPDVPELPSASAHKISKGEINIKDVAFAYPGKKNIFEGFNLQVAAKQKLGIVGGSGAGKTTLIKLLMRLYDVDTGTIEIDGVDVKKFTKSSLRHQIASVPQHLSLFHRSIYDNIAYGCDNVTQDKVIEAAKKANCHEFIMALENQYETIIGEQGVKLSGGQRQRIAIARAILKEAPILLLDEATSALDSATELAIQQALDTLLADKTAIIVAHRLSTLKAMDKIIVLEGAKIVEAGTHSELLALKGYYYKYWNHQSDGFIH